MNLRHLDELDHLILLWPNLFSAAVKEEDIGPRKAMWRQMLAEYRKKQNQAGNVQPVLRTKRKKG